MIDTAEPTQSKSINSNEQIGQAVNVIDGDTIDVNIDGRTFSVRYIGVNTPERGELCCQEAADANVKLVVNQTVRLVKDVNESDRHGRLLRYVMETMMVSAAKDSLGQQAEA